MTLHPKEMHRREDITPKKTLGGILKDSVLRHFLQQMRGNKRLTDLDPRFFRDLPKSSKESSQVTGELPISSAHKQYEVSLQKSTMLGPGKSQTGAYQIDLYDFFTISNPNFSEHLTHRITVKDPQQALGYFNSVIDWMKEAA